MWTVKHICHLANSPLAGRRTAARLLTTCNIFTVLCESYFSHMTTFT
eukprot:UN16919